MSNVEELPIAAARLTEYEALVAAAPAALDAIPGAVYLCDHEGWLVRFNSEAAELWGRTPAVDDTKGSLLRIVPLVWPGRSISFPRPLPDG